LAAVRSLFESSKQPITRKQFESFAQSILDGHVAILNISWIPRVRDDERSEHERTGARDGLSDSRRRRRPLAASTYEYTA
jgi:CHASE1-domain containing sensor protein